jgi:hypothetical protein
MDHRKDELLRILTELRTTSEATRRHKLQRLTKPVLVQVAEVMLRKWERERERYRAELAARDYHIERIEAMLRPIDLPQRPVLAADPDDDRADPLDDAE